ncbi:hypothetical protein Aperf_G00000101723 [Anoplocephala perfoliata]
MPYGRPVSRRRRRRFQNGESRGTPWAAIAARRASAAAATSEADSDDSNSQREGKAGTSSGSVVIAPSFELLRAGHATGVWPLRERLLLASALLDTDNRQLTWPPISRRLAKFTPPASCGYTRPPTWCSARACAKQYSLLLDSAEMFRKQQVDVEKSAEEGRVVFQAPGVVAAATATVGLSLAEFIVKRLTVERVEELRANVADTRKKHSLFKSMLARVENGEMDHCMDELWAEIERQEANKHEAEHQPLITNSTGDDKPPFNSPSTPPPAVSDEVVQFVNDLNSWQDPYDVPASVWTVSGGVGASLRAAPSVAKMTTGPRKSGPVGRPRTRPLHPVRANLTDRRINAATSLKSPPPAPSPALTAGPEVEDETTDEAADDASIASSTPSTECMTISDVEQWYNVPDVSYLDKSQQEPMEVLEGDSIIPRPTVSGLTSPRRRSGPTSPTRLPSSPRGESSTKLSPMQSIEEESLPLVDVALRLKKTRRPSRQQESKKPKTEAKEKKPEPLAVEETKENEAGPSKREKMKKKKKDDKDVAPQGEKSDKDKKEGSLKKKKKPKVQELKEPKVEELREELPEREEEDTFQPRSLRLRLSRQDDGNLTVVDDKPSTPEPNSPIKLRLSLSPVKSTDSSVSVSKSLTADILKQAFPAIKQEDDEPPRKKSRSSSRLSEKELMQIAKSILSSAEVKAAEGVGKSSSKRKIKKLFVHSVLKELTTSVYNNPMLENAVFSSASATSSSSRSSSSAISPNVAHEVYERLEPIMTRLSSRIAKKLEYAITVPPHPYLLGARLARNLDPICLGGWHYRPPDLEEVKIGSTAVKNFSQYALRVSALP